MCNFWENVGVCVCVCISKTVIMSAKRKAEEEEDKYYSDIIGRMYTSHPDRTEKQRKS